MSFDESFENFEAWITSINSTNPQTKNIKAFNFGLFESSNGHSAYLSGSFRYDESDDNWACEEDFVPEYKYFNLPNSFTRNKKWVEIQNDFRQIIRKFIESENFSKSFLAKASAITIGFDDGDLERVF